MTCRNHPNRIGLPCPSCGLGFCEDCLGPLGGDEVCAGCIERAIAERAAPPRMEPTPLLWAALATTLGAVAFRIVSALYLLRIGTGQ